MRVIQPGTLSEAGKIMSGMHVDKFGIGIMAGKTLTRLIRIDGLMNIAANILKQEMLSLGGDVAVSRAALTAGATKTTDCLIIGTLSQISGLCKKLENQPFGLKNIAADLKALLSNFEKKDFLLALGKYRLNLGARAHIMGIVNLTPDSFSGDGLCKVSECQSVKVSEFIEKMVSDGADIIDIGGESSRPGAWPVSLKEEVNRTIPLIKKLAKSIKVPISIDTYKPEVARRALDCGALMVNDITGLRNPRMAKLVAKYKAGVVIMHMQGKPRTMQKNPKYNSLIGDIAGFLDKSVSRALDCGICRDKIIIDPGIGFGKSLADNLQILRCLGEFKSLGLPLMVGASRKSFIGKVTGQPAGERLAGTIAANTLAISKGANIIRVHDVRQARDAVNIADSIAKGLR